MNTTTTIEEPFLDFSDDQETSSTWNSCLPNSEFNLNICP